MHCFIITSNISSFELRRLILGNMFFTFRKNFAIENLYCFMFSRLLINIRSQTPFFLLQNWASVFLKLIEIHREICSNTSEDIDLFKEKIVLEFLRFQLLLTSPFVVVSSNAMVSLTPTTSHKFSLRRYYSMQDFIRKLGGLSNSILIQVTRPTTSIFRVHEFFNRQS